MNASSTPRKPAALLVFLGVALFALAGYDAAGPATDSRKGPAFERGLLPSDTVKVFVVWGSSNACGSAHPNTQWQPDSPDPVLGSAYEWYRKDSIPPGPLVDPPTCFDHSGQGTENKGSAWPQFAITYADPSSGLTDHTVFLSSAANGGSTLLDDPDFARNWDPALYELYPRGVETVERAMTKAQSFFPGRPVVFGGILWNGGNDFYYFEDGDFDPNPNPYPWRPYREALHRLLTAASADVFDVYGGRFYFIGSGYRARDPYPPPNDLDYDFAYDLESDVCAAYPFCSMIHEGFTIKAGQEACYGPCIEGGLYPPGVCAQCEGWYDNDKQHWGQRGQNHIGRTTARKVYADEAGDPFRWEVGVEVPQPSEYTESAPAPPTHLTIYDDAGEAVADFELQPTIQSPDWRADFDGGDPTADWRPTWSALQTAFVTLEFTYDPSPAPGDEVVLGRYVYVPTGAVYAANQTDFFRPDDGAAAETAVRFEVIADSLTGAVSVQAGPGPGEPESLARLGPFFEDVFAASYVVPYNADAYRLSCGPACPAEMPGYFLAPMPTDGPLPTAQTQRYTFASEADVVLPSSWGVVTWDVANLELRFPAARRLIVEGVLEATDVRLTKAGSQGWGGLVYRPSAGGVVPGSSRLTGSVVEHVRRAGSLGMPQGVVSVSNRALVVEGQSQIQDGVNGAVGLLASGSSAVVSVTGLSLIQRNDGGGVRALGGADVTISGQSEIRQNPGGSGVRTDNAGTTVLLDGARVLQNGGPGVRALSNSQVLFANDADLLRTEIRENVGGLDANGGALVNAGTCRAGETAPCDGRNVHLIVENEDAGSTTDFDARSQGGATVFAQGNDWNVSDYSQLVLVYNPMVSVLRVCPLVDAAGCGIDGRLGGHDGEPGDGAGRRLRPRGGDGGGHRLTDVLALVEEAERAHLAGDMEAFELAASAIVVAIDTSASEDDRRAAFEATTRLFAWEQPEGPLVLLGALASQPGESRPWALRALAVGRLSSEDCDGARAASDSLVTGYALSEHALFGLALGGRAAVEEDDEAGALAVLTSLAAGFPESEEVGVLAALVAGAFPEVDLSGIGGRLSGVLGEEAGGGPVSASASSSAGPLLVVDEARPNPSQSAVALPFTLRSEAHVEAEVYDVLGRRVASLASGVFGAGRHVLRVENGRLSAGVYVARVTTQPSGGQPVVALRQFTLTR